MEEKIEGYTIRCKSSVSILEENYNLQWKNIREKRDQEMLGAKREE